MTIGFFTGFGMGLNGMSVKMSDYPERISISPVHRQKRDDDFYLVDRKAFPGKGVEYVRADMVTDFETHPVGTSDRIKELEAALKLHKELEVQLAKAVEALKDLADCVDDGCFCSEMHMAAVMDEARAIIAELKGQDDG